MKSYVAVQKKILVIIYSLWKNEEAFNEDYIKSTTREEEPVLPSRLSFEEAVQAEQKNSPDINQGYTRCTTVEVSSFAPSRLLQK